MTKDTVGNRGQPRLPSSTSRHRVMRRHPSSVSAMEAAGYGSRARPATPAVGPAEKANMFTRELIPGSILSEFIYVWREETPVIATPPRHSARASSYGTTMEGQHR